MSEGFFEFHERTAKQRMTNRAPRKATATPTPDISGAGAAGAPAAMSVSQLTLLIDKAIKAGVPGSVLVRGEVSNVSGRQASGHLYFTMKDDRSCINCVMWRDSAMKLPFKLEDGMEMIATGRVTLYGPQGRYQLVASALQPVGQGALELAFRQLRAKLQTEGLFDAERKKAIPPYPMRIAIVTSRATAALQDILKVLRRFSWLKLMLYHVPVQGEASGEKIAQAIGHLSRQADRVGGVEVILLARGGGSLEDLWAFNEEVVARAVAASRIPIITGIGHEVDCSIADLVADHHAHTPTEAAQVVTHHWKLVADRLANSKVQLNRGIRQIAQDLRQRLEAAGRHEFFRRPMDRILTLGQLLDDRQRALLLALTGRLRNVTQRLGQTENRLEKFHPRHRIELGRQRLASVQSRMALAAGAALRARGTRLDHFQRQLEAVSPRAVLGRGYSITTIKKNGQIVRSIEQIKPGDRLITQLADGQSESVAQDSRQMSLFE
jgi:exodeoxyribonuclease VII large subunit